MHDDVPAVLKVQTQVSEITTINMNTTFSITATSASHKNRERYQHTRAPSMIESYITKRHSRLPRHPGAGESTPRDEIWRRVWRDATVPTHTMVNLWQTVHLNQPETIACTQSDANITPGTLRAR